MMPGGPTYVVRHGPTEYSVRYRVNGDPAVPVGLTEEGRRLSARCGASLRAVPFQACAVSAFPRTRETAALLLAGRTLRPSVHAALNEIDYGGSEGRPFREYATWLESHGPSAVPAGGRESQREALVRMFGCLRGLLALPGPRLVVGHGLMLSVISWISAHPGVALRQAFFPEAGYLSPVVLSDDQVRRLLEPLSDDQSRPCWPRRAVDGPRRAEGDGDQG